MVREFLFRFGLRVTLCHDGESGFDTLGRDSFDAVVLDVMLPDVDGFELLKRVRRVSEVPVLMLTARGEATDRIVGLELGADDYLPKPFDPRELVARLRAILRRRASPAIDSETMVFGHLEIDGGARVVRLDGEPRSLTGYQFDILWALAESAGHVVSRDALMTRVRGQAHEAYDRSIDVHVSRIRTAIENDPRHPRRVLTVRGAGYLFARRPDDGDR